jgi:hypothetical protein
MIHATGLARHLDKAFLKPILDNRSLNPYLGYELNWGEPERAPHKRYSCARIAYYDGTSVTRNIFPAWLMNISAKYSIAHSCAWVTGRIYAALI